MRMAADRAGLSRLEMVLGVLIVILVIIAGLSTALFVEERGKSKEVEAGEGISEVAFVREGVVVALDQEEDVDKVEILDSTGTLVSTIEVGKKTGLVLADLDWIPHLKFRFDVHLANGDVLSSPGYAPEKPVPYKLFEISYADEFPIEEYHASVSAHSHTEAVLRFSKDGTRVAVGALEGRVSIIDIGLQEEIWVEYLPDLSIESVEFSEDGNYVFVGGHHTDYKFWCLDAATGDEVWSKSVKAVVGDTPVLSAPSTYLQTKGDKVWMGLSASYLKPIDGEESRSYMTEPYNSSRRLFYRSKLYCYDVASGALEWTFPNDKQVPWDDWGGGVMDRGLMQDSIMVDDAGKYLSVAFSSRTGDTTYNESMLVVFDAQEGEIEWTWSMPIIKPYAYRSHITNAWLSPDGKWIAVGSMDGRAFLFDNTEAVSKGFGTPEWVRNLGLFMDINGVITHTSDICPYTDGENVIFHVARTQDTTSLYGNSMTNIIYGVKDYVCFDMNGDIDWTFKIGETRAYTGTGRYGYGVGGGYLTFGNEHQEISGLTQDESTLYHTYYIHPTKTESYFTVLDLQRGSNDGYTHLMWRVRLDGSPATQGDLSEDGWYVAIAESPVDKDPTGESPDYHGIYRVMIYV